MKRIIIKLFMMILIVQTGQVFSQTNTNLGTYAGNSGTSNTSIGYETNNVVTGHSNTSVGGEVGDTLSDSFHVTTV